MLGSPMYAARAVLQQLTQHACPVAPPWPPPVPPSGPPLLPTTPVSSCGSAPRLGSNKVRRTRTGQGPPTHRLHSPATTTLLFDPSPVFSVSRHSVSFPTCSPPFLLDVFASTYKSQCSQVKLGSGVQSRWPCRAEPTRAAQPPASCV